MGIQVNLLLHMFLIKLAGSFNLFKRFAGSVWL